MAIKPILFNTEMVKAIISGRKTQTRRIIKGLEGLNVYHAEPAEDTYETLGEWDFFYGWVENECMFDAINSIKAPCSVGDMLWVRETWSTHYDGIHDDLQFCYKADGIDLKSECLPGENNRWYPSIHMPKEAARIFLKVNDVHVGRLQFMNEENAIAEGFADSPAGEESPMERFVTLWDKTIRREDLWKFGYDANPWVWEIEFERCEKPEWWCRQAVLCP